MINPEDRVTYFAETDARNKRTPFGIKAKDRSRHMYIIGKTGMGKSTLLENMAVQDIQSGEGLAFIDPHGGSAELLLSYVPQERINDVVYFAPFDMDYPISFNVMEDIGAEKRHLVVNGLMSAFKKIWVDAWSARMEYILNNIMLALLEYPDSTLLGVNRMLSDKAFRKRVVAQVTDPAVKAFWTDEFAKYSDKFMVEAGAAIQNKIGQFISNPLIRNIIGQPRSGFDIRELMDKKKIFIVNLSKGRIGEGNAQLLGSMLVTKIYLAALSRADVSAQEMKTLPGFNLYVDEFQSFANESFASILSEARKYKLALIIAHQYIAQMPEEVKDAVIGNVGTMIVFRIGSSDAEQLEAEFAPRFTIEDMLSLGFAQIYIKLMIDGLTSPPFSARTLLPIPLPASSFRDVIVEHSRKIFARPRNEVEQEIIEWHKTFEEDDGGERESASGRSARTRGSSFAKPPEEKKNMEDELRRAISQAYLKTTAPQPKVKDTKTATPEKLAELKKVIADVSAPSAPSSVAEEKILPPPTPAVREAHEDLPAVMPHSNAERSSDKSAPTRPRDQAVQTPQTARQPSDDRQLQRNNFQSSNKPAPALVRPPEEKKVSNSLPQNKSQNELQQRTPPSNLNMARPLFQAKNQTTRESSMVMPPASQNQKQNESEEIPSTQQQSVKREEDQREQKNAEERQRLAGLRASLSEAVEDSVPHNPSQQGDRVVEVPEDVLRRILGE